jgi:hypothetical protein
MAAAVILWNVTPTTCAWLRGPVSRRRMHGARQIGDDFSVSCTLFGDALRWWPIVRARCVRQFPNQFFDSQRGSCPIGVSGCFECVSAQNITIPTYLDTPENQNPRRSLPALSGVGDLYGQSISPDCWSILPRRQSMVPTRSWYARSTRSPRSRFVIISPASPSHASSDAGGMETTTSRSNSLVEYSRAKNFPVRLCPDGLRQPAGGTAGSVLHAPVVCSERRRWMHAIRALTGNRGAHPSPTTSKHFRR